MKTLSPILGASQSCLVDEHTHTHTHIHTRHTHSPQQTRESKGQCFGCLGTELRANATEDSNIALQLQNSVV